MIHEYNLMVREHHLDTFGHMNNATYLEIFEEARWELIGGNGYGMKEIHKTGQGPVILEVNLKFLKELKLRENITIRTTLLGYPGKVGQLKQVIVNENKEVAAEAIFTFALFDLRERKLIVPTEAWKRAVGMTP